MVESCCRLGAAINQWRLLCETPHFFVMPTLGSFGREGYLLIVTKEHFLGFGMLPPSFFPELNELVRDIRKLVQAEYGKSPLIFEHGPRIGEEESGQSIDHAHLHVIPGIDITDD